MRSSALMTLLFSAGLPVAAYEFERHSLNEREAMCRQLLATAGTVITNNPSVTLVEIEAEQTIYLITETGHFAHPSILCRKLFVNGNVRTIQMKGFTAAPSDIMSTWLDQFRVQDELVGRSLIR
jgi:hypothetical protein